MGPMVDETQGKNKLLLVAGIIVVAIVLGMIVYLIFEVISSRTIVEEEGVLLVKGLSEYKELEARYGAGEVFVKAVNLDKPGENAFLKKINPGFSSEPGCIIWVDAKKEGLVYQLSENFEILHTISLAEFKKGEANVDQETLQKFYAALK